MEKNRGLYITTDQRRLLRESKWLIRGGSRAAATSKMECFVITFNGFQSLTIITKHPILEVAAAPDPPLTAHIWLSTMSFLKRFYRMAALKDVCRKTAMASFTKQDVIVGVFLWNFPDQHFLHNNFGWLLLNKLTKRKKLN